MVSNFSPHHDEAYHHGAFSTCLYLKAQDRLHDFASWAVSPLYGRIFCQQFARFRATDTLNESRIRLYQQFAIMTSTPRRLPFYTRRTFSLPFKVKESPSGPPASERLDPYPQAVLQRDSQPYLVRACLPPASAFLTDRPSSVVSGEYRHSRSRLPSYALQEATCFRSHRSIQAADTYRHGDRDCMSWRLPLKDTKR